MFSIAAAAALLSVPARPSYQTTPVPPIPMPAVGSHVDSPAERAARVEKNLREAERVAAELRRMLEQNPALADLGGTLRESEARVRALRAEWERLRPRPWFEMPPRPRVD